MTVSVKQTLDKICNDNIFNDELYFTGGTALAFYLNHRVSEDIDRDKSRDLFDFGSILEHKILSNEEIVDLFSKMKSEINNVKDIINFIKSKKEPKEDEAVYLSESDRIDLNFEEIKEEVVLSLNSLYSL